MQEVQDLLAQQGEYRLAWIVYLSGLVMVGALLWHWTRRWQWTLVKYSARLVPLVALATPIPHPSIADLTVPAVILASAGWLVDGPEVAMPALRLLGLGACAGLILAILLAIIRMLLRRRAAAAPVGEAEAEAPAT